MSILRNTTYSLIPLFSVSALLAENVENNVAGVQRHHERFEEERFREDDDSDEGGLNQNFELTLGSETLNQAADQEENKEEDEEEEYVLGEDSAAEVADFESDERTEPFVQPIEFLDQFPEDIGRVLTYIGGVPVISSPYVGNISSFDGSHLITSFARTRLPLNILASRQNMENFMRDDGGMPMTDRPFVVIGGDIEVTPFIQSSDGGDTSADVNFREIYVGITAGINAWITAYTAFAFDSAPPVEGGSTVTNSNIFLDHGFVTIGNFNRSPFYSTIGQTFVPFGRYANYFINQTLPRAIGRTKAREIAGGYRQPSNQYYAEAFVFDADSGRGGQGAFKNGAYGATAAYVLSTEQSSGEFGVGYISTITDSVGFQSLAGFGESNDTEIIAHHVPAVNLYGRYNIGSFGFNAEYVGAIIRPFDQNDLSINGQGARPQAWDLQGAYFFETFERPTSIALGYSGTRDAAALLLPENRIAAGYNMSIWRNTVQQIELRRDFGYSKDTKVTGPNENKGNIPVAPSATALTLMMAVYY